MFQRAGWAERLVATTPPAARPMVRLFGHRAMADRKPKILFETHAAGARSWPSPKVTFQRRGRLTPTATLASQPAEKGALPNGSPPPRSAQTPQDAAIEPQDRSGCRVEPLFPPAPGYHRPRAPPRKLAVADFCALAGGRCRQRF